MADFSHIPDFVYVPELVARLEDQNELITNEILLEILNRITPPLLYPNELRAVTDLLAPKRGRPFLRGIPSRHWLAERIQKLDRPDVHERFLHALAQRIISRDGPTEFQRALASFKARQTPNRDVLIRGLYKQCYAMIADGPKSVQHEVLGEINVPLTLRTRSARAAEMTRQVCNDRMAIVAPAPSTIIKIAGSGDRISRKTA